VIDDRNRDVWVVACLEESVHRVAGGVGSEGSSRRHPNEVADRNRAQFLLVVCLAFTQWVVSVFRIDDSEGDTTVYCTTGSSVDYSHGRGHVIARIHPGRPPLQYFSEFFSYIYIRKVWI